MKEEPRREEIRPGVWIVHGAAPMAGTELTSERLRDIVLSLNKPWTEYKPEERDE